MWECVHLYLHVFLVYFLWFLFVCVGLFLFVCLCVVATCLYSNETVKKKGCRFGEVGRWENLRGIMGEKTVIRIHCKKKKLKKEKYK